MSEIKINDLKKTGKELCKLLWDDVSDYEIDIKASREELSTQILEGYEMLEPDEIEDDLSDMAKGVVEALKEGGDEEPEEKSEKAEKKASKKAKKEDTEDNRTLEEIVEESEDIDELKGLVKSDDSFKAIRKGIQLQKNVEKLKARMLEALKEEQEVPQGDKAASKKDKKEKAEKKDKAEKKAKATPAYNRVDAVCEALKEAPKTMKEWVELTNEQMESHDKSANDSENKFIIRYLQKMEKHFDFGVEMPKA